MILKLFIKTLACESYDVSEKNVFKFFQKIKKNLKISLLDYRSFNIL